MLSRKLTAVVLSSCLVTGLATFTNFQGHHNWRQPSDRLALEGLQTAFHGSGAAGDVDLFRSIWTKDAVFRGGGNVVRGREAIVKFFTTAADWGKTANLAPTYKSQFDIRGNKATIRFECVIVRVTGSSPLTTALSTLPPGNQNPNVEIIQHSNTTIEAVKKRGEWLIQTFTGQGGAIQ